LHRHELSDTQWQKIAPLIRRHGRGSKLGDRSFVNAVIFMLRTGTSWRDLPDRYGRWKTVYNRFASWSKAGHFERIFKALQLYVDLTPGQQHEVTVAASLLAHAQGGALIGDAGYDAESVRSAAAARGMKVVIPSNPTRAMIRRYDRRLYSIRYS